MKGDILNARLACVLPSAKFEIIIPTVQKEFCLINTPILGGGETFAITITQHMIIIQLLEKEKYHKCSLYRVLCWLCDILLFCYNPMDEVVGMDYIFVVLSFVSYRLINFIYNSPHPEMNCTRLCIDYTII